MNELRTLYRYRQLIAALTARDLKARYRGSILGFFWSLANPLLLLTVYTRRLHLLLSVERHPSLSAVSLRRNPAVDVLLRGGARIDDVDLLECGADQEGDVPRRGAAAGDGGVASGALRAGDADPSIATVGFALHGDITLSATMLLVPFLMILQTLFVAGIAMTVASASVLFRDLRDILTNLMQLGFFVTPILYLIDKVASRPFRALLRLNPMTPFVVSYQDVLFFGHVPGLADTLLMIAYAFVSVAMGITVFSRLRDTLAEAI